MKPVKSVTLPSRPAAIAAAAAADTLRCPAMALPTAESLENFLRCILSSAPPADSTAPTKAESWCPPPPPAAPKSRADPEALSAAPTPVDHAPAPPPPPPPPPAVLEPAANDLLPAAAAAFAAAAAAAASRSPPPPSPVYVGPWGRRVLEAEGAACGVASISATVGGLGGVLLFGDRPAGGEVDRDARFAMACVRPVRCGVPVRRRLSLN